MRPWREIELGDHITVLTDYHANGSYESLKKNVTLKHTPDFAIMVRTLNCEREDYEDDLIYLNQDEYNFLSKSKVYPDDILMNKIANAGSVYIMPDLGKPVSLAMNLFLIRFDKTLDQRFMYYNMKNNESYIKLYANGAATSTITKDAVRKLKLKAPDIDEQKEISRILYAYESAIEKNSKRIKLLNSLIKETYDYWFVKNGYAKEKSLSLDDQTNAPLGWKLEDLSEHVNLLRGIEPGSSNYSDVKLDRFVPFVRVGDLSKRTSNIYISEILAKGKICEEKDVLLSLDGSPGMVSIGMYGAYSTGIRKAVIKNQKFSSAYIYAYLQSSYIQNLINAHATGTTILHAGSAVKYMKILCPPDDILAEFNSIISPCFDSILKIKKQNSLLREAFEILLPRLMTGVIDVESYDPAQLLKEAA